MHEVSKEGEEHNFCRGLSLNKCKRSMFVGGCTCHHSSNYLAFRNPCEGQIKTTSQETKLYDLQALHIFLADVTNNQKGLQGKVPVMEESHSEI